MDQISIQIRILDERIGKTFAMPRYATDGSAGIDLYACLPEPLTIRPNQTQTINSGVAIFINNNGYVAVLAPRSGLSTKHGIILANTIGVIDSDYQNEIIIPLYNRKNIAYSVSPGERICQLIILPVIQAKFNIVNEFSTTSNRSGGFGSTGKM